LGPALKMSGLGVVLFVHFSPLRNTDFRRPEDPQWRECLDFSLLFKFKVLYFSNHSIIWIRCQIKPFVDRSIPESLDKKLLFFYTAFTCCKIEFLSNIPKN
jgi:hypothetical protein